jgi:dipeptidyl aminopeptidase/acylaminoacyl peptidase
VTDLLRNLLEARSALLVDVENVTSEERLLVRSDLTGTMQLYELDPFSGALRRLTDLPDPVAQAAYVTGRRAAVLEVDQDGDERHQLWLFGDLDAVPAGGWEKRSELTPLTSDTRFGHHLAGISLDGSTVAFTSNRRNGVDFDLWALELDSGTERCIYRGGGWGQPASGFSPDGRWVSLLVPGPLPLDNDLLLVPSAGGPSEVVLPHAGEAAEVGAPAWVGPRQLLVSSNVGRDLKAVVAVDLDEPARCVVVAEDALADLDVVSSPGGQLAAVIANRDGASEIALVVPGGQGADARPVPLPEPGVVASWRMSPPKFSPSGERLYFSLSTPRQAGDIWVYDLPAGLAARSGARGGTPAGVTPARPGSPAASVAPAGSSGLRRMTASPAPAPAESLVTPELHRVASFDGEKVPLFLYRPPGQPPHPVVVVVHGGPESQATRSWDPVVQGLAGAGYAVVVPNVRGSTGYGKRYASLDDTTRRLDSVHDLAAIHDWLPSAGLDPRRAALWGGSYGGYMVLAGVAFQPERWAAGVDIVGMSDLVTFLQNTSDYRRAHREREYGSLSSHREFLAAASPLRHAEGIRAPLFVVHGRNDPRVPLSEAQQLAAALRAKGVRCELVVYEDEGHGLARLANRLDAYPRALAFLQSAMQP